MQPGFVLGAGLARADDWVPVLVVVGAAVGAAIVHALRGTRPGRRGTPRQRETRDREAGVAELADATDSKSVGVHAP